MEQPASDTDLIPDIYSDEGVQTLFDDEEEEATTEEAPIQAALSLEERYTKSQLRIVRTNIDFTLHNLRFALNDPNYINFSPSYQRRDRWDKKKRSLLIESLLMNIPVPPVFLYENKYNQYEVMDGRQRLETLRDFLTDGFSLSGLEYWTELRGRKFSTLPLTIQNGLLRRTISAIVLLAETGEQKDTTVDVRKALFKRLNTGGVRLNPQELRNALNPSPFNDMLMRAARAPVFTHVWGIPAYTEGEDEQPADALQKNSLYKTMADAELVLRFFAIREMMELEIGGSLKSLLDNCMIRHKDDTTETVAEFEIAFLACLEMLNRLFGGEPFILPKTGRPSHTLFDSLMVATSLSMGKKALLSDEEIHARLAANLANKNDYNVLVNRNNTSDSIKGRVHLAQQILFGEGH